MKKISVGKTSSKGIAIGKAFIFHKEELSPAQYPISQEDMEQEMNRFHQALKKTTEQLEELAAKSDIFAGHRMLARDTMLRDSIIGKIKLGKNAEAALFESIEEFAAIFDEMDDEYMKERSADVRDVGNRLLRAMKGQEYHTISAIKEEVIVVAEDLVPSDTVGMDLSLVKGIITEYGGNTSHVSIIARSNGLPALVGVRGILEQLKDQELIILDATEGTILLEPDEATVQSYLEKQAIDLVQKKRLEALRELPGITTDGRRVKLLANAGNPDEVKLAVQQGAEGIGLYRSELLYMENTHFPTEEEQFRVYRQAAELCEGEVIIRTLDIGGDKTLSYYEFEKEANPFLGFRGIRISLELEEVFRCQLRAILRASNYGKIKLMLPMIISVEELIAAKELLQQCRQELHSEGIAYDELIEVGIMVETPAAVMNIEELAKLVDFFSIGTNDLTQYMLAVDRGNSKISKLYNSFHPAVLRSIHRVIETGQKYKINVSMCGEFASDPKAIPLLLGMGLREFSMSSGEIASVKEILRNTSYEAAILLAKRVLAADTIAQVMSLL